MVVQSPPVLIVLHREQKTLFIVHSRTSKITKYTADNCLCAFCTLELIFPIIPILYFLFSGSFFSLFYFLIFNALFTFFICQVITFFSSMYFHVDDKGKQYVNSSFFFVTLVRALGYHQE